MTRPRVRIKRSLLSGIAGGTAIQEPGTWFLARGTKAPIWLKDPRGHLGVLADHVIHDDGRVEPSVQCPNDTCKWHEEIILEDWMETLRDATPP